MRILQVIPSLSPYLGGPSKAVIQLSHYLQEVGADIEILTTDDDISGSLEVNYSQPIRYKGIKTNFIPRTLRAKQFLYSRALSKWHRNNLDRFDLIHTHYLFSYLPSWSARAAYRKNIPYIMRPLGQLTPWALSQSAIRKQLYGRLIENHNLQNASMIHCTSPGEVSDIENLNIKTPKLLVPLGVELPDLDRTTAQQIIRQRYKLNNRPILLFLSRLHPKKRLEFILELVHKLNDLAEPINLLIAGRGEPLYEQKLRFLTQELGITDQVIFTGFVDGEDKNNLLQGSDLFLLPSYSENFGIAVAEALAAATPVAITPNVQTSHWVSQYEAGWVIPSEISQWTQKLCQVLQSHSILLKKGENSRKLANQVFSWPAIARKLLEAYINIQDTYSRK